MPLKLPNILIAATIAGGLSLSAQAADASWQFSEADGESAKTLVFAQDVGGPSLSLVCSDKLGLQAILYLNGTDAGTATISSDSRVKSRNIRMSSDTTANKGDSWAYLRNEKILISTKPWQGRRLFNSSVKGENITLRISRLGSHTLTLPAIDTEFKSFAKSCAATRPAS